MLSRNVQVQSERECHVDETNGDMSSMEYAIAGSGSGIIEMEFWPLEHPTEPSAEDQPVKCPMSDHSSAINVGKDRSTETLKKKRVESKAKLTRSRSESTVIAIGDGVSSTAVKPDRKRHHTLTHGDIIITPIIRPLPQPAANNSAARELTTVLQMLHQTDHSSFEPAM